MEENPSHHDQHEIMKLQPEEMDSSSVYILHKIHYRNSSLIRLIIRVNRIPLPKLRRSVMNRLGNFVDNQHCLFDRLI